MLILCHGLLPSTGQAAYRRRHLAASAETLTEPALTTELWADRRRCVDRS